MQKGVCVVQLTGQILFDNSNTHCAKDLTSLLDPPHKPYLCANWALFFCSCFAPWSSVLGALGSCLACCRRGWVCIASWLVDAARWCIVKCAFSCCGNSTSGRLGHNGCRIHFVYLSCALVVVTCAGACGETTVGKQIGTADAFCVPVNCCEFDDC